MSKKIKIITSVIVVLFLLRLFVIFGLERYLTYLLQSTIKIESLTLYPLQITTLSLGGNSKLSYEDNHFIIDLDSTELSSVERMLEKKPKKKKIVVKGTIDGTITYNLLNEKWQSELAIFDALINGVDVNDGVMFFNDAVGMNFVKVFRRYLKNLDKSTKQTSIKHFQINLSIDKHDMVTLHDIAFKTSHFRVAIFGAVNLDGEIAKLEVVLLDKRGCTIMKQEMKGNIEEPSFQKTTVIVSIAKAVPSSFLGRGKRILGRTKKRVSSTMKKNNINLNNKIISKSGIIFKNATSKVIRDPKVVYNGKVEHPGGIR